MTENIHSQPNSRIGLLVSVRSAQEADCALQGGASLIDVKEPLHGSLGRATDAVIRDVVARVGGLRPVSAALGEWCDSPQATIPACGLTYAKWGLAGCRPRSDWRRNLAYQLSNQRDPRVVLTAYADWQCAQSPSVEEVFALAQEHPGSILLIDTCCKIASKVGTKHRPTLLDWLSAAWIEDLCNRARAAQVRIALAGSLGLEEIQALLPARPAWFAVRGAVCDAGDRHATVQTDKVHRLVELVSARNGECAVKP